MDPDSSSEDESSSIANATEREFLYEEEQIFEESKEDAPIPEVFLQEDSFSDSDEDGEDWESMSREPK